MTSTMTTPEIHTTGADLAKTTVYLKVTFGLFGNTRKVSNSQIEVKADNVQEDASAKTDKSWLNVNKKLLDSKELDAIRRADGAMRQWIYNNCLPSFDAGVYFAPKAAILMFEERLQAYKSERSQLIDSFLTSYVELRTAAKERLGSLFNSADYPPLFDLDKEFKFSWRYMSFGVPSDLGELDPELFAREQEKMQANMTEAFGEIQQLMRATLLEMVSHLRDRLTDDTDGKKKKLHESAIEKMKDFLSTFSFRNVTNDSELAALVEQARGLISGTSVEALRTTDGLRASIRSGMEDISAKLDGMVTKSGRKIREE
jgi:hypothetical protein